LAQALGRGKTFDAYISYAECGSYLSAPLADALNKFFELKLKAYGSKTYRHSRLDGDEPEFQSVDKPYTEVCTAAGCENLRDTKALKGLCVSCYMAGTVPEGWDRSAGLLEKVDPPVPKPPRSPSDRELRNRVIGARIRDARLARGWNQAQLGAAIGVSSRRISDLERGRLVGQWARAACECLGVEEAG
ncbi:MAG: helix-turn-helix domain-containing protein, partial [Dehalococcoidia bacterium]|nr:helix-turn-helix domain-containing protein [Dehalococcoidia bacterium]